MKLESLTDLKPDPLNVNKGTERGNWQLEQSLREFGAGRSIVTDRRGVVLAGNKTHAAGAEMGLGAKVVHTSGNELVVVVRDDLDVQTDTKARALALADNRVSETNYLVDSELLLEQLETVDMSAFWTAEELASLSNPDTTAPESFKEVDEDLPTDYCCPKCGFSWSGKQS